MDIATQERRKGKSALLRAILAPLVLGLVGFAVSAAFMPVTGAFWIGAGTVLFILSMELWWLGDILDALNWLADKAEQSRRRKRIGSE